MASLKKSLQQQIADAELGLKKLKDKAAGGLLTKETAGMDQVLNAIEAVTKSNDCNTIDVLKSISKIKKLGLTITAPDRKPRAKKAESQKAK